MPWFRVDDGLAFHSKTVMAGNAAIGLWVRAGSWCAQQLTDGFVPTRMVPTLGGTDEDVHRLVDARLWEQVDGGYRFWCWEEYQPTRAQVETERAGARERMRRVRQRKRTSDTGNSSSGVRPNTGRTSPLPSEFGLTDQMRAWAADSAPLVKLDREHEQFCDCWRGTGKSRKDWVATWRTWMRRAQTDAESRRNHTPADTDGATRRLWTPEAPPPEVADDPERYQAWMRDQRQQHRQAS